jgi:hypothetical protein
MSANRCSYCGESCDHPIRLNVAMSGRDREAARYTTLNLCTACSNSWCTDRSLKSIEREECVGIPPQRNYRFRAGISEFG